MATSESSILASLLKQPSYAQRLAMQASSTDPTPSVGAGIARALMGGIAGLTESGDKARRLADFDAEYGTAPNAPPSPMSAALMGGGQPAMQPQPTPQPNQRLATALSGPSGQPSPMPPAPMGPMDSFPNRSGYSQNDKIVSAVPQGEGPNQGVNIADMPPNAQPTMGPPTRMAQAPAPLPQQVPQNARQAPQIPADVMARARALAASDDPAGQARAAALLEPYKTPKDQEVTMTDAEKLAAGISPDNKNAFQRNTGTGKISPIDPQPFAVNLKNTNETAFEKTYGEGMAKEGLATVEAGNKALDKIQKLNITQKMFESVQTGKLAGAQATVGAWAQAVGVDPKTLGIDPNLPIVDQVAKSLIGQQVIGMIGTGQGGGGFPANNFSDADRKFLQSIPGSISNLPESNALLTEIGRRVAQRDLDKSDAWMEARKAGKSFEEFSHDWRQTVQRQPLFSDLTGPDNVSARAQQPAATGSTVIDGYTIKRK